ncbi:pitrilysin family protein [Proteiniphilum sp. X52]|uniref:M16 family metallopeptidase n=1 Tax=Proteiniphilum sp. X52 TaxID=2382159 RepID=UPI000F0A2E39|nr:insulinase family protein [Proteiniphilum sp. X52]RNC65366.1 insulinase family protein [Proteiniphilum sp. X52]
MKKSAKLFASVVALFFATTLLAQNVSYSYESVPNDPINTRIYTLDNGLKVYMSVNRETPRIQTFIAVRVGGKNDPAETTGLAHYFEHLMFKGTDKFGTLDYEREKPLLDEIERLFEVYRNTTDEDARRAIYQQIDSVSYEASKLAIPNEYDKLMSAIGATGTNAYTGFDMTVYTDDIPSNQVENWAKIQAERFQNSVIRGFHTELETVYEEKNMSLTQDGRKVYEKMLATLFPHHPYGTQTVLGSQEHLKNPSITNIKEYYKTYYVPNNMAVCLAGDFDPDEMIRIIDTHFGGMKPNRNLPPLPVTHAQEATEPVSVEVLGLEAANVSLGWRFPGSASQEKDLLDIISLIMNNGQAGLVDLNLIQQQKVLSAYAGLYSMSDYCAFVMGAHPKQGQTLEEARDLLLGQIDKLKKGEFSEELISASVNNLKLSQMRRIESNAGRANWFVSTFINRLDWKDQVDRLDRLARITKQDVVNFANAYFKENYAVIYKREGKDPNELKIAKPQITPIVMNRDARSQFLLGVQQSEVKPIEPVFLDFEKDLKKLEARSDIPVLYKQNVNNGLFSLIYVFDMGNNTDKAIGTAFEYMRYLGTSTKSPEEIKTAFYNLACSFGVYPGSERVYVMLSGLAENMNQALDLFEELLADAQVNPEAYANLTEDILKKRNDAKLNQGQNFNKLLHYAIWGPDSPDKNVLSEAELNTMDPEELVARIRRLNHFEHRILYYGPDSESQFLSTLDKLHRVPDTLTPVPKDDRFKQEPIREKKVYLAKYDAKQIYMAMVANDGIVYDPAIEPIREMYNEYFSGNMNSIVFQEMRESRGLAYSAYAYLMSPSKLNRPYILRAFIATQNDKMDDALKAFHQILDEMPESENAFNLAKEGLITRLRTDRITKENILWAYVNAQDLGLNTDRRKELYQQAQSMTLSNVKAFQEKWVKNRTYAYCILGNEEELDLQQLETYGPLIRLSQEDIFGF